MLMNINFCLRNNLNLKNSFYKPVSELGINMISGNSLMDAKNMVVLIISVSVENFKKILVKLNFMQKFFGLELMNFLTNKEFLE